MDLATLLPVAWPVLAVAMLVTALAAAVQGTIGFGFAIVSVPVLSLVDPVLAPVPQLLVILPLTVSMAWRERYAVDVRGVGWILAGRLPGAVVGIVLLKVAAARWLDVLLAGMVLAALALLVSGAEVRRRPATDFGAGVASGAMGLVSSIGGPPLALLLRHEKGPALRSTLATIFTIGLCITLGTRLAAGEIAWTDLHVALWLLPSLFVGLRLSRHLHGRVEGRPLRVAILLVSAVASVGLLFRALT